MVTDHMGIAFQQVWTAASEEPGTRFLLVHLLKIQSIRTESLRILKAAVTPTGKLLKASES